MALPESLSARHRLDGPCLRQGRTTQFPLPLPNKAPIGSCHAHLSVTAGACEKDSCLKVTNVTISGRKHMAWTCSCTLVIIQLQLQSKAIRIRDASMIPIRVAWGNCDRQGTLKIWGQSLRHQGSHNVTVHMVSARCHEGRWILAQSYTK